jgi:hypothetical protein
MINDTKAKVLLVFRSYCKGDRKLRTKPRVSKAVDGRHWNKTVRSGGNEGVLAGKIRLGDDLLTTKA